MDEHLQNQIIQELHTCYKNLRYPDFSFIQDTLVNKSYCLARDKLAHLGAVDMTYLNGNICETLHLKHNSTTIGIHLSLIGKYFYLECKETVLGEDTDLYTLTNATVIDDKTDDPLINNIISCLKEEGFLQFTEKELLELLPLPLENIRINFWTCERENVEPLSVKGLLFTPTLDQHRFHEDWYHRRDRESKMPKV